MLSNKEKNQIKNDLKDFDLLDDSLLKIISDQEKEIKKEKEKTKGLIKKNTNLFKYLGIQKLF